MTRIIAILLFLIAWGAVEAESPNADCVTAFEVSTAQWEGVIPPMPQGFCIDGYYFESLIAFTFWRDTVQPTFFKTRFLYQAPGVIDETAHERGLTLDGVEGYIALYTPAVLGYKLWIRPDAASPWIAMRDADSAAQVHAQYHVEALKSGVEVSWEIAEAWGIPTMVTVQGRYLWDGQVCITEVHPELVCTGEPTDLVEWFKLNILY